MAKTTLSVRRYVDCPHCGTQDCRVDHLIGQTNDQPFGPWHCEHCNKGYKGVGHPDGTVTVELLDSVQIPAYTLVELPPQTKPVFFVLKDMHYAHNGPTFNPQHNENWINEHTCPTNWIRDVDTIVIGENDDPHGLFRYVRSVPRTDAVMKTGTCNDDDVDAASTFPEITGQPAPGAAVIVVLDPWTDPSISAPFVRLLTKPGRKVEHPVVEGDCIVGNGDLGVLLTEFPHINQELVNRVTALDCTNEELTTVLLHTTIVSPEGAVLAHATALSDTPVGNAEIISLTRSLASSVPETASFIDKLRALAGAHVSAAFANTLLHGYAPAESDFANLFTKTAAVVGTAAQIYDADVRAILATVCYSGDELGFVREMQIFHHGRFH